MARVLTCMQWNETTETCELQAWVEESSPWPGLTLAEGQQIGDAMLVGLMSVLAIKLFLKPGTHRKR